MGKTAVVHRREKGKKTPRPAAKKVEGSQVLFFRSLKRMLFGKPRKRSVDLLDKWILKKHPLGLFF